MLWCGVVDRSRDGRACVLRQSWRSVHFMSSAPAVAELRSLRKERNLVDTYCQVRCSTRERDREPDFREIARQHGRATRREKPQFGPTSLRHVVARTRDCTEPLGKSPYLSMVSRPRPHRFSSTRGSSREYDKSMLAVCAPNPCNKSWLYPSALVVLVVLLAARPPLVSWCAQQDADRRSPLKWSYMALCTIIFCSVVAAVGWTSGTNLTAPLAAS